MKWAFGLGIVGGAFSLLKPSGGDAMVLAGSVVGGFVLFALIGLVVEYVMFDSNRRKRRWSDD